MTYRELFTNTRRALSSAGITAAQMESFLLLEHACAVDRTHYPLVADTFCPSENAQKLSLLIDRRIKGEPIQYILGKWEFYGYEFFVGKGVLIPRPETELLVQTALDSISSIENPVVADLCSGSGCIAISIKKEHPDAEVYAFELSDKAFSYLTKNIELNCADVNAVQADILAEPESDKLFDIIVSNPPYIRTNVIPTLEDEVKQEPVMALDGDADGLRFYKAIPKLWSKYLKRGGVLAFEIGYDQGEEVSDILKENGFTDVQVIEDLSGQDRVCVGKLEMKNE